MTANPTPRPDRLTVGSLFTGIGGFDLAAERAGMTLRWQCEIDPYCRRVLTKHWPDVPKHGDIRSLTGAELGPVDIITAGFPCQPVSNAGKRLGTADERWLWPETIRIIRLVRPRYVVLENVAALLGRGMGDVLGDLSASGFAAEWQVISAAAVGAPHLRERVWIVAYRDGTGRVWQSPGDCQTAALEIASGNDPDRCGAHVADADRRSAPERGQRVVIAAARPGRRPERSGSPRLAERQIAIRCAGEVARLSTDASIFPKREQAAQTNPITNRWQTRTLIGSGDWWQAEPAICRVAYGVPGGVDRLRGLGNAIVPQIAEFVFERIAAHAMQEMRDA